MVTIKICGVRTLDGAKAVADSGAHFAGFLFVPGRRRTIDLGRAIQIRPALGSSVEPVGVFMDAPIDDVRRYVSEIGLRTIQLHGDESTDYVQTLATMGLNIIRAFSLTEKTPPETYLPYRSSVSAFLFDGPAPGSGQGIASGFQINETFRDVLQQPIWLAGGLNPENVGEAIGTHHIDGVDVASGVEIDGEQSPKKIAAFVQALRRRT